MVADLDTRVFTVDEIVLFLESHSSELDEQDLKEWLEHMQECGVAKTIEERLIERARILDFMQEQEAKAKRGEERP